MRSATVIVRGDCELNEPRSIGFGVSRVGKGSAARPSTAASDWAKVAGTHPNKTRKETNIGTDSFNFNWVPPREKIYRAEIFVESRNNRLDKGGDSVGDVYTLG
jgi:hypothetical protein